MKIFFVTGLFAFNFASSVEPQALPIKYFIETSSGFNEVDALGLSHRRDMARGLFFRLEEFLEDDSVKKTALVFSENAKNITKSRTQFCVAPKSQQTELMRRRLASYLHNNHAEKYKLSEDGRMVTLKPKSLKRKRVEMAQEILPGIWDDELGL